MNPLFKVSLRELFALALFVGLAIASMRFGGVVASITITSAILITMMLAIVAFVALGDARSFAIGFLMPVVIYTATVVGVGETEYGALGPAVLPTTQLLDSAYPILSQKSWIDTATREAITGTIDPNAIRTTGGMSIAKYKGSTVYMTSTPSRTMFLGIGHVLIAVMLGYVGGKFAVVVHRAHSPN